MAPRTSPRSRARRSCIPPIFWCLLLAWAVIFVGSNIAKILMLPDFFVRRQREVIVKPPTYYDILGVTPLVDDETLRQFRKEFAVVAHPDKLGSPEAMKQYLEVNEAFETLTNGPLRCEYDKMHRIKGRFAAQTCRSAFPEEYSQKLRDEQERIKARQEHEKALKKKGEGKPPMPKTEKPQSQKFVPQSGLKSEVRPPTADPQASWKRAVPVITVELEPEPEDGVDVVTKAVAKIWKDGLVHTWLVVKTKATECNDNFWGFFEDVFGWLAGAWY